MTTVKEPRIRRKKEKGERYELTLDQYTNACLDRIQALGFGSRKAAVVFAIQKTSELVAEGKIKKP